MPLNTKSLSFSFLFVVAMLLATTLTGCGPQRAASTHTLAPGWYYLGPVPTPAQRDDALGKMIDGASDHRYEDLLKERYSWGRPAVVYLEQADPGVLVQREPSRIQMAAGKKMRINDKYAGVQVVQDGDTVMVGDGVYYYEISKFSMYSMMSNPAYVGTIAKDGQVDLPQILDPGNEWYTPALINPRVPAQPPIVLLSKEQLAAIK